MKSENVNERTTFHRKLYSVVERIVNNVLNTKKIVNNNFHNGKIASIVSSKLLTVYVDGSTTAQKIPCNPDVTFNVGDEVFVIYINGDSRNKFVLCKRGV